MDLMAQFDDNHFDIAIVDPPYGLNQNLDRVKSRCRKAASTIQKKFTWDKHPPGKEYFIELQRVSKNQIIWGANHFISRIPYDSPCWIVWDKVNGNSNYADCELAWTSFDTAVRQFRFMWNGFRQGKSSDGTVMEGDKSKNEKRIVPTQKPIKLYDWLLINYAFPSDKILDTHMGSGSIAIACHYHGYNLTACEIDHDYYINACARIRQKTAQMTML